MKKKTMTQNKKKTTTQNKKNSPKIKPERK